MQDLNIAIVQQWKKDELRIRLKELKKIMDDMDKARKAALVQTVSTCAISLYFWQKISREISLKMYSDEQI